MPEESPSSCYMEISREDLRSNAKLISDYVGVPVIGVIKCDGYGVSVQEAAAAWVSAGVTMFGVSDPLEAFTLREAGYSDVEILLLAPVSDEHLRDALIEQNVILTVSGLSCAQFYTQYSGTKPIRVHVAVDTGMGRFGTAWTDSHELLKIYQTDGLHFEGIFSHFSSSFESQYQKTSIQLERFLSAVSGLESQGIPVGIRHIANSCAALRFPETRLDAVRIGSGLVGRLLAPVPVALKKVGVFKAYVVDRRTLKKGETTGYASICTMKADTEIAVVAIGHYNGFGVLKRPERNRPLDLLRFLRQAFSLYRTAPAVYYQGKPLKVVGRIGTQYTLVDAGGTDLSFGSVVTAEADLLFPNTHHKYI